jgi:osmotically inducible protein OsmC
MADEKRHVHEASATADVKGVRSDDDVVAVALALAGDADAQPDTTTPEHLMAAALAGCLQQALTVAASTQDADVAPTVISTVTLNSGEGGGYTAVFDLVVSGLDGTQGAQMLEQAKALCPFTKALDSERLTVRLA